MVHCSASAWNNIQEVELDESEPDRVYSACGVVRRGDVSLSLHELAAHPSPTHSDGIKRRTTPDKAI